MLATRNRLLVTGTPKSAQHGASVVDKPWQFPSQPRTDRSGVGKLHTGYGLRSLQGAAIQGIL